MENYKIFPGKSGHFKVLKYLTLSYKSAALHMALFAVVCPGPEDYTASESLFSDGLTCVHAVAAGQAWFTDAAKTNMSSFT